MSVLQEDQHSGTVIYESGAGSVLDCTECGFAHMNPLPTPKELRDFYETQFYQSFKPDYRDKQIQDLEWWEFTYRGLLERLERAIGRKGRLLDIGCGPGLLVEFALKLGWRAVGVEPSPEATESALQRGLNTHTGEYDDELAAELGVFDVIVMNQTLEHIADPAPLLRRCHRFLSDQGALGVVVANDFSPLQLLAAEKLGLDQWWVQLPEHVNYFSPRSLQSIFLASGFQDLRARMSYPLENFLLKGFNYPGDQAVGARVHQLRKDYELSVGLGNPDLFEAISQANVELSIGRHVEVIGLKTA